MATFAEIEDLRDWFIDSCGEFLAKIDVLNGDEPASTVNEIKAYAEQMHGCGLNLIKLLDDLLIAKKREDYS